MCWQATCWHASHTFHTKGKVCECDVGPPSWRINWDPNRHIVPCVHLREPTMVLWVYRLGLLVALGSRTELRVGNHANEMLDISPTTLEKQLLERHVLDRSIESLARHVNMTTRDNIGLASRVAWITLSNTTCQHRQFRSIFRIWRWRQQIIETMPDHGANLVIFGALYRT